MWERVNIVILAPAWMAMISKPIVMMVMMMEWLMLSLST
jgi:hypothetical protein